MCTLELEQLKSDRKQMLLLCDWYTTVFDHFFAKCIFIFHKAEVQTVSLRCLTDLNPYLFKSYDTKSKYFRFCVSLRFCKLSFLHLATQNDRLYLSFVKDKYIVGKKWSEIVIKWPFISCHFFELAEVGCNLRLPFRQ